jgi:hypothetical protein
MPIPGKSRRILPAVIVAAAFAWPARAVEIDKFIPPNTEAVIIINLRELLNSAVIRNYGHDKVRGELESNEDAKRFFRAAGFDPLRAVHQVVIAYSAVADTRAQFLVVLHGEFDTDKIQAAFDRLANSKTGELQVIEQAGRKLYEIKRSAAGNKPFYAVVVDNNTLLVAASPEHAGASFKGGARSNPELAMVLSTFGGKECVCAAAAVTEQRRQALAGNGNLREIGPKLQYLTGFVDLTEDVKLKVSVQASDEDGAAKVKATLGRTVPLIGMMAADKSEKLGPALTELAKKVEIKKEDKNAVSVSLTVTPKMMKEIADSVEAAARADKDAGQ